jgi:hypothetical protein
MTGKEHHTSTYSSADIEKYLRGELSAPEMHALERAALDDPFLADALEGITLHQQLPEQPVFREDVAELQGRLQDRVTMPSKRKFFVLSQPMRYAAAAILLLGLGLTAYFTLFNTRMSSQSLARSGVRPAEQTAIPPQDSMPPPDTTQGPAPATGAVAQSSPAASQAESSFRQDLVKTAPEPVKTAPLEPALKKERDIQEKKVFDHVYKDKKVVVSQEPTMALTPSPSAYVRLDTLQLHPDTARFPTTADRYIASGDVSAELKSRVQGLKTSNSFHDKGQWVVSGKVTDPYNHPLPGAFLALRDNATVNAVTDRNGQFNLLLSRKMDTAAVVVNYTGYEQGFLSLSNTSRVGNVIQLQPQAASLNEVTVVGFGSKRRELLRQNIDAKTKELSLDAVPAIGWPAYHSYIEMMRPNVALDSTLRGAEVVSFIVNKEGKLSSFKVEQSISPAHDSSAIRMIRQGPPWKMVTGKRARARVIITY